MPRDPIQQHGVTPQHNTHTRTPYDYYGTPPNITQHLLDREHFQNHILEPCSGKGHITKYLQKQGYKVTSLDIQAPQHPDQKQQNYLTYNKKHHGDLITNPPYTHATQFVTHALRQCTGKIAMLLKLQFLETITRYEKIFKKNPPSRVHVFVKRVSCIKNNQLVNNGGGAMCFAWYVWDPQPLRENNKETVIKWIPNHKP